MSDPSKPLVAGWKTVVNPEHGTAFDVPPDWEVLAPSVFSGHTDRKDPDKLLIGHTAPAFYKSKWCSIDADGDGRITDVKLGAAGTKGAEGAKDTAEIAEKNAPTWVYAAYTQPDKSLVTWDKPVKYRTKSGVEGTYVKARSAGVKQTNRCAGDGQAIVFGFKNSKGGFVAWNFYGRTGVPGAVGDDLVMRILSTVRLSGDPKEQTPCNRRWRSLPGPDVLDAGACSMLQRQNTGDFVWRTRSSRAPERWLALDEPRLRQRTTDGTGLRQPASGIGGGTPPQDEGRPALRRTAGAAHGGRAARKAVRGDRHRGRPVRRLRRVVLRPAHAREAEGRATAEAATATAEPAAAAGAAVEVAAAVRCGKPVPVEAAEIAQDFTAHALAHGQVAQADAVVEEEAEACRSGRVHSPAAAPCPPCPERSQSRDDRFP